MVKVTGFLFLLLTLVWRRSVPPSVPALPSVDFHQERIQEPWSETWDIRDSMLNLYRCLNASGLNCAAACAQRSADTLSLEVLAMINEDTRRRMDA